MIKKHKFLLVILIVSSILMFLNLTDRLLWSDESYTAMFAKNTLKYGYPKAYDGENIICSDFDGESAVKLFPIFKKENYALIYSPWLEMYTIASSFFLFGFTTFAARFPFALLGLLSLILLYFFSLKLTKNKNIANLSIFLLTFYIPFYLYSRTARYHSLTMFFCLLALYFYLEILENKKAAPYLFVLSTVLLFYTHYIPFFATYATVILHFLIFKFNNNIFKKLMYSSFFVFCFTFPWFLYVNFTAQSAGYNLFRILKGVIYLSTYFSLYIIPFVFYFLFPKLLHDKKNKKKIRLNEPYFLLFFLIFFSILMSVFGHSPLPSFRYIAFLFPLAMILVSQVILNIRKYNKYMALMIILLLIFTNYLFIFPFKPFEKPVLNKLAKNSDAYLFVKDNLKARYFIFDYIYEITHHYSTPEEKIINIIIQQSDDGDIVLTNWDNEFYTFYANTISYRHILNKTPNWVIPRIPYYEWGGKETDDFVISKINKRYDKIIINSTDYIYPIDSPHPRDHRFRENKELKTSSIYPYETYPIEIYHLVE